MGKVKFGIIIFSVSIICVALTGCGYVQLQTERPQEYVMQEALDSMVMVTTYVDGMQYTNGSGFVITNNGYIVTNFHVVFPHLLLKETGTDTELTVMFEDERSFKVDKTYSFPRYDIALVKINAKNLPKVRISESGAEIGERVFSIGCPPGIPFTITDGIVSKVNEEPWGPLKYRPFHTTALMYGGFSGGATFNFHGEVIGINVAVFVRYQQISLAIPVRNLRDILKGTLIPDGPHYIAEMEQDLFMHFL